MRGLCLQELIAHGMVIDAPPGQTFKAKSGLGADHLIDLRGSLARPPLRALLTDGLVQAIHGLPSVQAVVGIAKSGIAYGVLVAERLGLPYATVLPDGPRSTGAQRAVEGDVAGLRVVLVDNCIVTGTSLDSAAHIVRGHGGNIVGAVVCTNYAPITNLFMPCVSLFAAQELIDVAVARRNL